MLEIKGTYPAEKISYTLTNLQKARNAEHREWSDMYASYTETALDEGFKYRAMMFKMISKVELRHTELSDKLIERLESNREFTSADGSNMEWMCRKYGYARSSKSAPEKCPVCGKGQDYFKRMPDNY